jgi:crotonobetainyl-CoA:carnitine CoA-transferase CaiB-like acyl-CoA transferase
MISAMTSNYMTFLGSGSIPVPLGTGFPTLAPYRTYRAQDRSVGVAVGSEKLWAGFCKAIGRMDLFAHPDYAANPLRAVHRSALDEILSAVFLERPASHWIEALKREGVPCSPVNNFAGVASHAQSEVRKMFPSIDGGTVTGPPIKLSATPGQIGSMAPLLGEHTFEVLAELLDVKPGEVADLAARRVVSGAG